MREGYVFYTINLSYIRLYSRTNVTYVSLLYLKAYTVKYLLIITLDRQVGTWGSIRLYSASALAFTGHIYDNV